MTPTPVVPPTTLSVGTMALRPATLDDAEFDARLDTGEKYSWVHRSKAVVWACMKSGSMGML